MTKRRMEVFDYIFEFRKECLRLPLAANIAAHFHFTQSRGNYYLKMFHRFCFRRKITSHEDWKKIIQMEGEHGSGN
jgi:hypothetical protein